MELIGPVGRQVSIIDSDETVSRVADWNEMGTSVVSADTAVLGEAKGHADTKDADNRAAWAAADTAKLAEANAYTDTEVGEDRVRLTSIESTNTTQDTTLSGHGTRITAAELKNTDQDGRLDAMPSSLLGPKVVSLDTDGVPYWNPTTGTHRIFLDTDGTPYYSVLPWPGAEVDTDGVPALTERPTLTWTRSEANARFATLTHAHAMSDVTGLEAALEDLTPAAHIHAVADVTGLQTELDGKAPTIHGHAVADVTGLQTTLDGKAATAHTHAMADVTGLSTAFDPAGSADAAEASANNYAGTLAYGTDLQATDAVVASFADDPATETGIRFAAKMARGELVFNVLDYGADKTGATATHAKINDAVLAAYAAGGGIVWVPPGTYLAGGSISLRDGVYIVGAGQGVTVLRAGAGLTTAILLGTSGNTVSSLTVRDITLDGDFATNGLKVAGVQLSAAKQVAVRYVTMQNMGGGGVVIATGTIDSIVEHCTITGTGLHSGDTHGISITNGSHRNKIRANRITAGEAMGIYIGSLGNGSTDTEISGNYIETVYSDPGLECIGVSAECIRTIITGNHTRNSNDNGISITASESVVIGNIVDGALRSGIAVGGDNITVIGNRVRNPGMHYPTDGLAWGGVSISGTNNIAIGNVIYDDQTTPTMAYGIKEISPGEGNVIIGNRARGYRLAEFLRAPSGASTLAFVGTRPTITGSRDGNAALTSLLSALSTAGLVNNTTTT